MKTAALIPARYQSTRFPGKPLALICGKPMIQWVYESVNAVSELDMVYVATDDKRIYDCVEEFGGKAIMTSDKHQCGTERIAECADLLSLSDEDIVLNIQGDEPLIMEQTIKDLISTMENGVLAGTLREKILNPDDVLDPNIVKVISDKNDNAIYFSRYPIPYNRSKTADTDYYRHIGVYAYKVSFLKQYAAMEKTPLEITESLEQLRILENGYKIKVKETTSSSFGVDTPEQIEQAEKLIKEHLKI